MLQAMEGMWIHMGSYGQFRDDWVIFCSKNIASQQVIGVVLFLVQCQGFFLATISMTLGKTISVYLLNENIYRCSSTL